ncbi:hypothetical protein K402DRAFT_417595 [Aulographum hederae CBS 113979]|uniref:Phosphatidic acid phosphatase type 2/haloperoxidase domain-containing protein n=1 Tax=Aulographum hederae CBS 113979 TaxID=1176131 RepID=A0A6G1HC95_9PEZI|nr:hypothetical protein K402DRAFT_417595 [Aulographum hederae CBS 113979]
MTMKLSGAAGYQKSKESRNNRTNRNNNAAAVASQKGPAKRYDAGMRDLDHYVNRLPRWRYELRQRLIPIVRAETPYLALMQQKLRNPTLDSYFAFTANLGTHTFFMIMLPILFWCGYTDLGKAMTHMLAAGVFWSGYIKDMLCLPRPLSPPLQRITMSGSAALEYGFPSTHSTNAVSVAVYAINMMQKVDPSAWTTTHTVLQTLLYWYAFSIVIGRMYCGMHGFFDVVIGTLLGAAIAAMEITYGQKFDNWVCNDTYTNVLIVTLVILALIRMHPEPADDCPCFDDSVAFAAVIIGVEVGAWHFASTRFALAHPVPATVPYSLEILGWFKTCVRILLGVLIIFAWRGTTKPLLLRFLPPVFRVFETLNINLPRKFFTNASQYTKIPSPLHMDDNILPPAREIPSLISNTLRHPRRRAISIGPQSEADAYETLAYRSSRRKLSLSTPKLEKSGFLFPVQDARITGSKPRSPSPYNRKPPPDTEPFPENPVMNLLPTPLASRVQSYEQMMGTGDASVFEEPLMTPPASDVGSENNASDLGRTASFQRKEEIRKEDNENKEMFKRLERPRVRYDVEVITKLVVYAGIAWLAVEGNPILFELCGLGMAR